MRYARDVRATRLFQVIVAMGISAGCGARTGSDETSPADTDASEGDIAAPEDDAPSDASGFTADVPSVIDSGAPEVQDAWVHGIK